MVARYSARECIGRGGFGSVYRGVAIGAAGFEKAVAIKFLHDHAQDMLPRLRDEARLLTHLRHRAIVRVDDLVELEGRWAIIMELVEGEDLARLGALGAIPPRVACEIVAEAAAGLDAAHSAVDASTGESLAIVHRDLKPANLRLTPRGEVKLLDFGVAHASFATREGSTRSIGFGTPGYLAPERHDGVDTPAGDVYALGVVLAECLLGERLGPVSVEPARHAARVAEVVARLPGEAGRIVSEMLAYHREERPTAREVSRRLAAIAPAMDGSALMDWAAPAVAAVGLLPAPDLPSVAGSAASGRPKAAAVSPGRPAVRAGRASRTGWILRVVGLLGVLGVGAWSVRERPSPGATGVPDASAVWAPVSTPVSAPVSAATVAVGSEEATADRETAPAPAVAPPAVAVSTAGGARRLELAPNPPDGPAEFGAVVVEGDADAVRLEGPGGPIPPGSHVPAGSWHLVVRFGAVEVRPTEPVSVAPGGAVRVRCLRAVENCAVMVH